MPEFYDPQPGSSFFHLEHQGEVIDVNTGGYVYNREAYFFQQVHAALRGWANANPNDPRGWDDVGEVLLTGASAMAGNAGAYQMRRSGSSTLPPEARLKLTIRKTTSKLEPAPIKPQAGRRGSASTRADIDVQRDVILKQHPDWAHTHGGTDSVTGAPKPEMYVPGAKGGRKGSTYPDLSFRKPDGSYHHHNTVDTYADGVTLTKREAGNLTRLQTLRPQDTTSTSPKP